jgi:hypothetical protein
MILSTFGELKMIMKPHFSYKKCKMLGTKSSATRTKWVNSNLKKELLNLSGKLITDRQLIRVTGSQLNQLVQKVTSMMLSSGS